MEWNTPPVWQRLEVQRLGALRLREDKKGTQHSVRREILPSSRSDALCSAFRRLRPVMESRFVLVTDGSQGFESGTCFCTHFRQEPAPRCRRGFGLNLRSEQPLGWKPSRRRTSAKSHRASVCLAFRSGSPFFGNSRPKIVQCRVLKLHAWLSENEPLMERHVK